MEKQNSSSSISPKYLKKRITRRQAIKVGGIAAIGLVFSKPVIETIRPKPAFAQYKVPDPPGGPAPPTVTHINLNDFFADPTVTVAVEPSTATLLEDPFFSPVLLANDPFLGDPNVIIPSAGASLVFEFDFVEGAGSEDDEFGAFIIDASTGLSLGGAFEFFTQDTSTGTVSFDLSTLVGTTLGLQFQLSALPADLDFNSSLTVSNLRIES